jgi:hypothetical protein
MLFAEGMKHAAASKVPTGRRRMMIGGNDGKTRHAENGKAAQPAKSDVELLALRLAKDSDISEEDARELIRLIGTDWTSLVREARFLKSRH